MILSGRVGLYINTNKDGKIRLNNIAELKEGDCIGESALLYGAKHTSSAITTTNVELMILLKEDYDQDFKGDEMQVQEKILKFYKKQPIFENLTEEKLEFIVKKTKKPLEYKTTDVIVKQGGVSEAFFFVAKGRAKVVKRLDFKKSKAALLAPSARDYEYKQFESKLIEIEEISKGALIGAYESLRSQPYFASVICTMPCLIYKISLQDLRLLDYFETQALIASTLPPPSDNDIRSQFMNDTMWNTYRSNFVESVRKEKKFKERFNFRMPAVNWYKGRSITPENIFGMPRTHLRLAPIEKLIPLSRTGID
jgi:CRP-like cAMP-binding protein